MLLPGLGTARAVLALVFTRDAFLFIIVITKIVGYLLNVISIVNQCNLLRGSSLQIEDLN